MLFGKKIFFSIPKKWNTYTHMILVNNIEYMIPPSESNSQEF